MNISIVSIAVIAIFVGNQTFYITFSSIALHNNFYLLSNEFEKNPMCNKNVVHILELNYKQNTLNDINSNVYSGNTLYACMLFNVSATN